MKKTKAEMFKRMVENFRNPITGRVKVPRKLALAWFDQAIYAAHLGNIDEPDHPQGWKFNDGSAVILMNPCQIRRGMTVHLR